MISMAKKITMAMGDKNTTISQGFELFIRVKKMSNLAEDSIYYYERCYKPFQEFFGEDFLCENLNTDNILEYIEHLKCSGDRKSITINTHIRGIRAILYYFMERKYTEHFKIQQIRFQKPIKETFTDEEIDKLIEKPDINNCSFAQFRNWAIACYMFATGNRLSTIQNLKLSDINIENMEITLRHTKNKKTYIIPMSSSLREVLKEYLLVRGGTSEDYLFCTVHGNKFSNDGLGDAIEDYNNSRGVLKTGLHIYRHTFAKNWIRQGGDIFRLQKMLGHSSLEMVKQYVNMFSEDLKENFDKVNTLDKHRANVVQQKVLKMKRK